MIINQYERPTGIAEPKVSDPLLQELDRLLDNPRLLGAGPSRFETALQPLAARAASRSGGSHPAHDGAAPPQALVLSPSRTGSAR